MRTLDWYILRQFFINFGIVLLVMFGLFMLVDTIVDLDEFVKAGKILAERHGGWPVLWSLWVVADWYGPWSLLFYSYLSGIVASAAMGFTLAGLGRTRELVAMVAGGISLHRVAAPVIVGGFVLGLLSLPIQELAIPALSQKLARQKSEVGRQAIRRFAIRYLPDAQGSLFSAAAFNGSAGTLTGLTVLRRDAQGRVLERITAETAHWNEARKGWDLPGGHKIKPDIGAGVEAVDFIATDLTPRRLMARRASFYPVLLSVASLQEMASIAADRPDEAGQFRRIMHSRFSLIAVNVLMMVMALPYFLSCNPQHVLTASVKTAAIVMGAWALGLVLLLTGMGLFNPVTAAWLPVVVYLPLAAGMLMAVRT